MLFLTARVPTELCAVVGCLVIASVTPIQYPEPHNVRHCLHAKNRKIPHALSDFKCGLWFVQ